MRRLYSRRGCETRSNAPETSNDISEAKYLFPHPETVGMASVRVSSLDFVDRFFLALIC